MYEKLSKHDFYKNKIHYLGHIISKEGTAVDPENIESIMNQPTPRNMTESDLLWDLQDTKGGSLKDSPSLHIQSPLHKTR